MIPHMLSIILCAASATATVLPVLHHRGVNMASTGITFSGIKSGGVMIPLSALPFNTTNTLTVRGHFNPQADISASATKGPKEKVEKRELLLTILTIIGTAALEEATTEAVSLALTAIKGKISDIAADWTASREAFTQAATLAMWNSNPDATKWPGVVCYNEAYTLRNDNVDGRASLELRSGLLHTDYDCMYLGSGNAFWTRGEGGFINLAYRFGGECVYDAGTGDLTC